MNTIITNSSSFCRCGLNISRCFTTSAILGGRKTRKPFDSRREYPPTGKEINQYKKGGNAQYPQHYGRHGYKFGKTPQPTGYYDKQTNAFHSVPEMIPEFVVPDLTDFPLKPYVSYKTQDIYQSELTPKALFDGTIGKDILDDFAEEKGTIDEIVENVMNRHSNK